MYEGPVLLTSQVQGLDAGRFWYEVNDSGWAHMTSGPWVPMLRERSVDLKMPIDFETACITAAVLEAARKLSDVNIEKEQVTDAEVRYKATGANSIVLVATFYGACVDTFKFHQVTDARNPLQLRFRPSEALMPKSGVLADDVLHKMDLFADRLRAASQPRLGVGIMEYEIDSPSRAERTAAMGLANSIAGTLVARGMDPKMIRVSSQLWQVRDGHERDYGRAFVAVEPRFVDLGDKGWKPH
jgi:hypothetical protein